MTVIEDKRDDPNDDQCISKQAVIGYHLTTPFVQGKASVRRMRCPSGAECLLHYNGRKRLL